MNQQKYIMSAVLVVVVGAAIFLGFRKFPQGQDSENTSNIIDYDEPIDSLQKALSVGKRLFVSKCASCHSIFKDGTGPALLGVTQRGPWKDSVKLYKYIRMPESFGKNNYIDSLRRNYGSNQMAFPKLSNFEIKSILQFINKQKKGVTDVILCE